MKGIFHPDKWNDWDDPLPDVQEIRKLFSMRMALVRIC